MWIGVKITCSLNINAMRLCDDRNSWFANNWNFCLAMALMTSYIQSENTNFAFAYRLFVGRYRTAIKSGRDKYLLWFSCVNNYSVPYHWASPKAVSLGPKQPHELDRFCIQVRCSIVKMNLDKSNTLTNGQASAISFKGRETTDLIKSIVSRLFFF